MGNFVAADIGGTAIKYGLLTSDGTILERHECDTRAQEGGRAIVERVLAIIHSFLAKETVEGICISTAGMVDCEKGEIFFSGPQIPDYIGVNWKKSISDAFGLPCEVENDVNCAGLSEALDGAGKDASPCLCLTIGTGIGGCAVLDGRVIHGFSGSACEVGYMRLPYGTFQELASASALIQRVTERTGERLNGKQIFARAAQGDAICDEEIARMCSYLAQGIANICYVLNPEVVVLGGGIMAQHAVISPMLTPALDHALIPAVRERTRIAFAQNGNWAGLLGAFHHYKIMRDMK